MLCPLCTGLLHHVSTEASTDTFVAYHSTYSSSTSCILCSYFWCAAKRNDNLKWVIGNHSLLPGQYDLEVSLTSMSSRMANVLLQAVGPMGLFTGENIIISSVLERQTQEQQRTSALTFLKEQLKECLASHHHCSPHAVGISPLPTRVIDVGLEEPRLYVTNGTTHGEYIALSHCWGRFPQFTTTSETLADRISGMPMAELPKTFADAVSITRGLGFRYLWIDSICILQDSDKKDWEKEASKMSAVYSNARMTIAAASATDGREGCFHSRITPYANDPNAIKIVIENTPSEGEAAQWHPHFLVRVATRHAHVLSAYSRSPLSQRAWVLQEMTLSPRILFFAQDQVYWMCAECVASEDGLYKDRNSIIRRSGTVISGLGQTSEATESFTTARTLATTLTQLWYDLVEDYSRRHLTYVSDKLGALAGMTNYFLDEMCDDKPAVGLWESDLYDGILWLPNTDQISERVSGLPSWSWASFNGPIMFPHRYMSKSLPSNDNVEFLRVDIYWSGVKFTSSLQQASIQAEGLIAGAKCTVVLGAGQKYRRSYPYQWGKTVRTIYPLLKLNGNFIGGAVFDGDPLVGNQDLTFLNISLAEIYPPETDTSKKYHNALLIERREEGYYRRIGAAFISFDSGLFSHVPRRLLELR